MLNYKLVNRFFQLLKDHEKNTGAEPSLSVFHRSYDEFIHDLNVTLGLDIEIKGLPTHDDILGGLPLDALGTLKCGVPGVGKSEILQKALEAQDIPCHDMGACLAYLIGSVKPNLPCRISLHGDGIIMRMLSRSKFI